MLVVCNPVTEELGALMRIVAQGEGADATLAVIAERDSHAAEPPAPVAAAMLAADVVLAPTIQSLSHTAARKAAERGRGADRDDAGRHRGDARPGDGRRHAASCAGAGAAIGGAARRRRRGADHLRDTAATCGSGSRAAPRSSTPATSTRRGAFGNLPCGEGFIAPLEGTGEGTLVVDGSIAGVGQVEDAGRADRARRATSPTRPAPRARRCSSCSPPTAPDGTNVAELGIGTNEEAILTGNILEDEKILGTAHVAFGASAAIGGTVQVPVHLDCVILEPTVEIDGEPLVRDGELLV